MPFIGNQPALSYTSFAKQDFTTSATTSYTLDHPVTNENEIALFINFVRQEPTTSYTATNTTLTLTSATSASDDMYCVFLGKAVQTVNPPSGSVGLSQLSATGTKDATTFLRGDNTFASAGGDNTPAFFVELNSSQSSVSDDTFTKVTFNNEEFDTDSAYDHSTNYRFTIPSGAAGKYLFFAQVDVDSESNSNLDNSTLQFKKNGSVIRSQEYNHLNNPPRNHVVACTILEDMSVSDYMEIFVRIEASDASGGRFNGTNSFFGGYKIIT